MMTPSWLRGMVVLGVLACGAALVTAQGRGGQAGTAFPGGRMNDDGSLLPAGPVSTLFSQEAYTQYEILEPGSEAFAITYLLAAIGPTIAGALLDAAGSWTLVYVVLAIVALAQIPVLLPLRKGTVIRA